MSTQIEIGDLRHRVSIERSVRAADGGGGAVITWLHVADVWAAVWPRTAAEELTLDRVAGRATHDVWIRHRAGVAPEMRLRLGARTFDIRGVLDIEERGRWLKCIVEERDL